MENQILSKRLRDKFESNGYLYVFDKSSKIDQSIQFWRCERKDDCRARIHVLNGNILKVIGNHSHESSAARVESCKVITQIKRRATTTVEGTAQIVNECVQTLSQAAQATLPNHDALKKVIRRKRNEIIVVPPYPLSLEQLVIPDQYKNYFNERGEEEVFLLIESGPGVERILLFGRETNIQVKKLNDFLTKILRFFSSVFVTLRHCLSMELLNVLRRFLVNCTRYWPKSLGQFFQYCMLFYQTNAKKHIIGYLKI